MSRRDLVSCFVNTTEIANGEVFVLNNEKQELSTKKQYNNK